MAGPSFTATDRIATPKFIGILSVVCTFLTINWLVLLIISAAHLQTLDTFDKVLSCVSKSGVLFYGTYVNAAAITVNAIILMTALCLYLRPVVPLWSRVAFVFIPIYGTMNLGVYLSQITAVPRLLALQNLPEYRGFAQFLLMQTLQVWPNSIAFAVNSLAYAVLGIPSIIIGISIIREGYLLATAGILLALSGIAGIIGFAGIATQNPTLSNGSLVGGILFLCGLIAMSGGFLKIRY
jgi:hypothetical protein